LRASKALCGAAAVALVTTAVALGDPLDPQTKIVKSDQAAASAALLTRADLGSGWAGGPTTPTNLKAPRCPALEPTFHDLTLTGHAEAFFHLDSAGWQIDSDVTVLKTAKQVATQYKRLFKPGLVTCIRYDVLKSTGSDPNAHLGSAVRLTFPRVGDTTAAFRTSIFYKVGKQTVLIYDDTIFLAKNRTQFWLNLVAPSTDSATLSLRERQIARTLVSRAHV
jgi:hypothetical protein